MGKIGFPKHIVISLPRVLSVIAVFSVAAGGVQLSSQAPPAGTLQVRQTRQQTATPAVQTPAATAQAPAVQTPTPAKAPAPQPATLAQAPHAAAPAPVVTPSNGASVNGLAPVDPTPAPDTTTTPAGNSTPDTSPAPAGNSSTAPPQQTTSYTSTNWSGYMATTGHYTAVSGSWTVPAATGTPGKTTADTAWIGIGGVSSNDLIQAGTFDTVDTNGNETVQAFYEMLPAAAKFDTGLTVSVGDSMSVSIAETSPGSWRITIADNTTGKAYTETAAYTSSYSSVEWIEEDPSQLLSGGSIALMPLDIFAPVAFTGGNTTDSGTAKTIAGAGALPITLASGSKYHPHVLALPSAIAGGDSFTVTRAQ